MKLSDFSSIEWTPVNLLKAAALLLVGVILLSVVVRLVGPTLQNVRSQVLMEPGIATAPSMGSFGMNGGKGEADYAYGEDASLSVRNIASMPVPYPTWSSGTDAEAYEVTDYAVTIETSDRDDTCTEVAELKKLDYVVFESAHEYDQGCSYRFKVAHAKVDAILSLVDDLDPKFVSQNTRTIKEEVDDYTSQTEILEQRLKAIDDTLTSATKAYDDITILATRALDADALARIIDSRINTIQRLTMERVQAAAELERVARAKAQSLDRVLYSYFTVDVTEVRYVDGTALSDSWKYALQSFVYELNRVVQDVTIGLITLIASILKYALYLLVLLVAALGAWRMARTLWLKAK